MLLKIGELARSAGLTVRTLHYDAIGLLRPSARSEARKLSVCRRKIVHHSMGGDIDEEGGAILYPFRKQDAVITLPAVDGSSSRYLPYTAAS